MKKFLVLFLMMMAVPCWAIPQLINYQGSLTATDGTPLDTTVAMTFTIHRSDGNIVWTETHPAVVVVDGLFNVLLGSVTPLEDEFTADRTLGITVGNNTMMVPRKPIVSVAHAYRVGTVDGSSGGIISGSTRITGQVCEGSGSSNAGQGAFASGTSCNASGDWSTISGGLSNDAVGDYSVIAGGYNNSATASYATIAGGWENSAAWTSTVSGGVANNAAGFGAVVGGGRWNLARGIYSFIGGGGGYEPDSNSAPGTNATIGGGSANLATGDWAFLGGGRYNRARGDYSVIAGGGGPELSDSNSASGANSCIPGGSENIASGDYSFAAGFRARARHYGSFVWGSYNGATDSTASFNSYTFTARCANGARFYTSHTGTATGVYLSAGGGSWGNLCDVRQKNLYGDVNTSDVLQKISALPLHRWSYKSQDENIQHIGPTAQDFYAAFGLGESDTTINTLDPDGVALAAIQELAKQNEELRTAVRGYQEQLSELRAQFQSHMATEQRTSHKEN